MLWFRKAPAVPSNGSANTSFRPQLEALDDRCVPNVSPVFDAAGGLHHYVVDQTSSLIHFAPDGTPTKLIDGATTPVRVAHGFRDTDGGIGLVYALTNGDGFMFSKGTTTSLGTGDVLDVGFAYAKDGSFRLDVLYANATTPAPPFGTDLKGDLIEFTAAGATTLGTNVRWANTYEDANGGTGLAMGVVDTGGNLVVTRSDSTGTFTLYKAPDGATQDVTDFSQTVSPNGVLVAAVTFGRFAGTYSLEFAPNGVVALGSGTDIKVGG